MVKVADYIFDFLAGHGVKHVFMLAGGGSMHLVDSLGRNKEMEYVPCLHEQAAALAAQAYAEFSNSPGVVLVTTGPGGTNAVTGVAAAWVESSPVLFLSGQVRREHLLGQFNVRSLGQQELDIVSVVKPITKYAVTVLDPQEIRFHLEKALSLATAGRPGPVWLDIPLNVQAAEVDEAMLPGFSSSPAWTPTRTAYIENTAASAFALLKKAKRPVLLIGNGARSAYLNGLVEQLVNRLKIPTLLTWKAADMLPEDCPYYAGRPGSIASRGANFTQQNSDLLLILGARLDLPQIAFNPRNFAPRAKKVVVEIDPAEIARLDAVMDIDVAVGSDVATYLKEFLYLLSLKIPLPNWTAWLKQAKDWQRRYPVILPEYWQEKGHVDTYCLLDVLSDLCLPSDILAPGSSGQCSDIFLQSFRVKQGQRVVNSPGLGAMGTGLPASIGACLASGRRRTICVNGDGGFQLNIQDLETVRRLDLPIKFFILCNGGYASIMATQRAHFGGHLVGSNPASGLTLPDVRKVAEAYGITTPAFTITGHQNLRAQVSQVLACDGPVVCAVSTSPSQPVYPRATSSLQPDGTMTSLPMEDLVPLLPRDELRANILTGEDLLTGGDLP